MYSPKQRLPACVYVDRKHRVTLLNTNQLVAAVHFIIFINKNLNLWPYCRFVYFDDDLTKAINEHLSTTCKADPQIP